MRGLMSPGLGSSSAGGTDATCMKGEIPQVTEPLRTQIEQLHRQPLVSSSLANSRRIEPQWQLAL